MDNQVPDGPVLVVERPNSLWIYFQNPGQDPPPPPPLPLNSDAPKFIIKENTPFWLYITDPDPDPDPDPLPAPPIPPVAPDQQPPHLDEEMEEPPPDDEDEEEDEEVEQLPADVIVPSQVEKNTIDGHRVCYALQDEKNVSERGPKRAHNLIRSVDHALQLLGPGSHLTRDLIKVMHGARRPFQMKQSGYRDGMLKHINGTIINGFRIEVCKQAREHKYSRVEV